MHRQKGGLVVLEPQVTKNGLMHLGHRGVGILEPQVHRQKGGLVGHEPQVHRQKGGGLVLSPRCIASLCRNWGLGPPCGGGSNPVS